MRTCKFILVPFHTEGFRLKALLEIQPVSVGYWTWASEGFFPRGDTRRFFKNFLGGGKSEVVSIFPTTAKQWPKRQINQRLFCDFFLPLMAK